MSSRHRKLIVAYTVFLYKSMEARFLYEKQVKLLCKNLPIVASSVFGMGKEPSHGSFIWNSLGLTDGRKSLETGEIH